MRSIKSLLIVMLVAATLLPASRVFSQSGTNSGGSGLSISPTKFEFVIERGKAELASIQVKNVTEKPIIARVFLNDFEQDGLTGNPKLIIDPDQEQSARSIREFVVGLEDAPIAAGETAVFDVPIQIPEDAAPGAYYGAIRFLSVPADSSEDDSTTVPQVSLNASVAALILVEVPGNITEKIEVSSVSAYLNNEQKGSLFTKKPTKVGIEINNLGNGFAKPFGNVTVQGPWGKGEVQNYELNDSTPRGNILPNSKRLFIDALTSVSLPGRYTIQANVSHGNGGDVLIATTSFWYIPTWVIIVVILLVLLATALSYYLYRKYVTKSTKKKR